MDENECLVQSVTCSLKEVGHVSSIIMSHIPCNLPIEAIKQKLENEMQPYVRIGDVMPNLLWPQSVFTVCMVIRFTCHILHFSCALLRIIFWFECMLAPSVIWSDKVLFQQLYKV